MASKGMRAGRGPRSVLRRGRISRHAAVESLESRRLLSAGDLDPTFGVGGKVTTDFPGSTGDRTRRIALQSDGKLLEVAWHGGFGVGEPTVAVTRFNADGTVDRSFGDDGIRLIDFPGRGEILASIAVGPGGKIAVATWSFFPTTDLVGNDSDVSVALLDPDGSFDTAFGGDGMQVIDVGQTVGAPAAAKTADFVWDVAVQADGKVVTIGSVTLPNGATNQSRFAVTRFNTDGGLDTSFGGTGVVVTPFGNYGAGGAAITIDDQNRIVAAGTAGIPGATGRVTNFDFAVARYNPDGSLDTSFDGDGFAVVPVGTPNEQVTAVATAPGGKIVVAGGTAQNVPNSTAGDIAVVRVNDDGSPDSTFDGDGILVLPLTARTGQPTQETAQGLAVQSDGSIVLSGRNTAGVGTTFVGETFVLRLDPSGALDSTFGDGGKVISTLNEGVDVVVDPDDGSVLLGGHVIGPTTGFEDFAAARYDASGNLDTSYGDNGVASADFQGPGFTTGWAAGVDSQGRIIVGGFHFPRSGDRQLAFARYNPDGSLDPAFGTGGMVRLSWGDTQGAFSGVSALAIDAQDRIVFTAEVNDPNDNNGNILVGRLTPAGAYDADFGAGEGFVVIDGFDGIPSASAVPHDLVIQPDGRIVVAGDVDLQSVANVEFGALRLEPDGQLDLTFGPSGTGMVHVAVDRTDSRANAVALAPDQDGEGFDIVLAGKAIAGADSRFAAVRLNDDGTPDPLFGGGLGMVMVDVGNTNAVANAVEVDSQGYIVMGGSAFVTTPTTTQRDNFALVRLTPAGDVDFNVLTDFNLNGDEITDLVVLPDRSVVAGGSTTRGSEPATGVSTGLDFALARYTPGGSLDLSFGTGGKVTTTFTEGSFPGAPSINRDEMTRLLLYPGDRVVAVGTANTPKTGNDFALARYLLTAPPPAEVAEREVFYNRSAYDGNDPALNAQDLAAVARDKSALRGGAAPTFDNVTTYARGINGLHLRFDTPLESLTAADFVFKVASIPNGAAPVWQDAPAPVAFSTSPGGGATHAFFAWADGAIKNTWLQVTVLANDHTRLARPDVFAFGNLVGETGDSPTTLRVSALDLAGVKRAQNTNSTIAGRFDFNRDGRVNALDLAAARSNLNRSLPAPPASALSSRSATSDPATSLLREPDPS